MDKMRWAVKLFRDWQHHRNKQAMEQPQLNISPILVQMEDMTVDELNFSISRFIVEVKKEDRTEFPPSHAEEYGSHASVLLRDFGENLQISLR